MAESSTKGVFVDLVKALDKEYKDGKITFSLYPFKRSVRNVVIKKADVHLPFMKSKKGEETLLKMGLEYALERSNRVPFALYYNKDKNSIDTKTLENFTIKDISKYKIETDAAHVIFFDNSLIAASTCLECSIKKLNRGRIDGFIFAAREVDAIIKKLKFKNLDSILIKNFDAAPIFRATKEGKETNKIISNLIKKLRDNGKLDKIMLPYTKYYKIRFDVDAL